MGEWMILSMLRVYMGINWQLSMFARAIAIAAKRHEGDTIIQGGSDAAVVKTAGEVACERITPFKLIALVEALLNAKHIVTER